MSIEGLAIALIIGLLFLAWLVVPFVGGTETEPDEAATNYTVERQRERLRVYYERVLRNIHDLDEDYALGKLTQAEYTPERELWVQRGVKVLKAMDELDSQHLIAPAGADEATIDEAIEGTFENEPTTTYREQQPAVQET